MSMLGSHFRARIAALFLGGSVATVGACAPAITTQQEVQVGQQQAAQINQQLPIVRDGSIHNYINQIGQSISRVADPRGIPYRFYVVNSNAVNAFAIPGGHVYVTRALIERSDNLSELTGVLGHEIAHVTERHGIEQWQRAQQANMGLSVLYGVLLGGRRPGAAERVGVQAAGGAWMAGNSREAEREADQRGIEFVARAGYHPRGMVTFFNELLEERKRSPSRLEQWFSTHPLTEERIANTSRAVSAMSLPGNLVTDTRAFQSFRARVRSLPAAPQGR